MNVFIEYFTNESNIIILLHMNVYSRLLYEFGNRIKWYSYCNARWLKNYYFFFLIHLSICTFYAFNIVQAESLGRGIPTWKIHTSVGCERIKNTVYILHNSHCSTRMKRPNRGEVPNNYCGRTGVYLSLYYIICV